MITKLCKRCATTKPVKLFYAIKSRSDGLSAYCRLCVRKINKAYQQSEAGRSMLKKHGSKTYKLYRAKSIARSKVGNAVKKGLVVKPENCENCGSEAALEGHHDDYSQPLEVTWLCNPCHKLKHGRLVDTALLSTAAQADPKRKANT